MGCQGRPVAAAPQPEAGGAPYAVGESEFRTDLERIRFAQSFSRLAEVTQVVTAGATCGVVHNRLTHTIKVTAVARAIAVRLLRTEDRDLLRDLGGLDHVVVQAAASAHDLGHPPFGHLGERVAGPAGPRPVRPDRRLRGQRADLPDPHRARGARPRRRGPQPDRRRPRGRAEVPVGPDRRARPASDRLATPPRGAGHGPTGPGAAKFSAYLVDLPEMLDVLAAFPDLPPGRQTLECSVMDLADDIAYSLHDVEDFHRSGVLQFSPVSSEFRSWLAERRALAAMRPASWPPIGAARRRPGAAAPSADRPGRLDVRRGRLSPPR